MDVMVIIALVFAAFVFLCVFPIMAFAIGLHFGMKAGSQGTQGFFKLKGDAFQAADVFGAPVQASSTADPDDPLAAVEEQMSRFTNLFNRQQAVRQYPDAPIGKSYVDPVLAGKAPDRAAAPGVDDE